MAIVSSALNWEGESVREVYEKLLLSLLHPARLKEEHVTSWLLEYGHRPLPIKLCSTPAELPNKSINFVEGSKRDVRFHSTIDYIQVEWNSIVRSRDVDAVSAQLGSNEPVLRKIDESLIRGLECKKLHTNFSFYQLGKRLFFQYPYLLESIRERALDGSNERTLQRAQGLLHYYEADLDLWLAGALAVGVTEGYAYALQRQPLSSSFEELKKELPDGADSKKRLGR